MDGILHLTLILVLTAPVGSASSHSATSGALAARESRIPADTGRAVHLLSRATFGLRSSDLERVLVEGEAAWIERQLHPERIADSAVVGRIGQFPAATSSVASLYRDYPQRQVLPDTARPDSTGDASAAMAADQRRALAQRSPGRILGDLVGAKLVRSVHSERQLEEVMTDFWFNHFNVFWGKGADRYLVGDYERTAIRPHVFGRFEDLLMATAKHPAMLFYLDNWTSAAPDPQADRLTQSQRRAFALRPRARGINENYARELLELHTLGVDGGYTQGDVIHVARAFTGWTLNPPRPNADAPMAGGGVGFVFRPAMHDRGEKTVLGQKLAAGRGIEDGEAVIRLLARHPATARHIAMKLVERFVSDQPDPELVDHLAGVFERTGGDLREVTRALFTSEAFYAEANRGSKVKSPFILVASALRATGAEVGPSRRLVDTLRGLGQVPYLESAPTGYPAVSEDWVNSGSMLNRMNFAIALAGGRMDGIRVDGAALADGRRGAASANDAWLEATLDRILPATSHAALLAGIRADLTEQADAGAPRRALAARAIGLVLGSPEFQRY